MLSPPFIHFYLFRCDKPVCIGNWQQKNITGSCPASVQNIFDLRRNKFTHEPPKQTPSNGYRSCDRNLEDLNQQARLILKSTQPLTQDQLLFLNTLFSFHPTKPVEHFTTEIKVDQSFGQPTFYISNDPISIKKCLVGLQAEYLKACEQYAQTFFTETQVSTIAHLLTKIAKKYPFSLPEIFKHILKAFPH